MYRFIQTVPSAMFPVEFLLVSQILEFSLAVISVAKMKFDSCKMHNSFILMIFACKWGKKYIFPATDCNVGIDFSTKILSFDK